MAWLVPQQSTLAKLVLTESSNFIRSTFVSELVMKVTNLLSRVLLTKATDVFRDHFRPGIEGYGGRETGDP